MSTIDPNAPQANPVPPRAAVARTRWITPALGVVAALAIGLLGGILIGQSTATPARGFGIRAAQNSAPGGTAPMGFTSGTVVSVKNGTLVVKTRGGDEKTVATTGSTKVTTTSDASLGDLAAGDTVTVIGRAGDDGTIDASVIAEGQSGIRVGGRPGAATPSH